MRASNLTISIPFAGCDKNCTYCVSKMTGIWGTDPDLMERNAKKALTLADHAGVTSVLFTGKGEPFLNIDYLMRFLLMFQAYPCEVQTNGILLNKNPLMVETLADAGMNVIAISIDKLPDFEYFRPLFVKIREHGMVPRVTLNVWKATHSENGIQDYVDLCRVHAVQQLMVRNLSIPTGTPDNHEGAVWIKRNVDAAYWASMISRFKHDCANGSGVRKLRTMAHGDSIWDYKGVAVSHSDYCIQDQAADGEIRSLIFLDDGHLYTAWNSRASILI
jgi:hypothetical protein